MKRRNACSLCARRKVKCDKAEPCSNCVKTQAQCQYNEPAMYPPRKRAADEELLARLTRYEDLMKKHGIDFTPYANTWVSSGLEIKYEKSVSQSPGCSIPSSSTVSSAYSTQNLERCLWSSLNPELKHPPIHSLRHKEDPFFHPIPSLNSILSSSQPSELHKLHPEPRQIYRLWQIFVESVNPLVKIIHVPSLQQRILDASWDPATIPDPLAAIMFAIYTLAIVSMSSKDCQTSFGESRDTLLVRYRTATLRALSVAEFLSSRKLEVLQAFVLFLLADPESELSSTLVGAALRIAQKMGLHREDIDSKASFFEKEMRIRPWWHLCRLYCRVPSASAMKSPPSQVGNVRLPLNVNDADLHPDMTEPPVEHSGPTEMMCVLIKFEVSNWLRSSPTAATVFENILREPIKDSPSTELEDKAINEIEAIYQQKFLRNLDPCIPLHALVRAVAKLAIARMRFKVHHPQGRASANGREVRMARDDIDMVFESALTMLEMVDVGTHSEFSSHLFTDMTSKFQMDAYIYVISELRQRTSGNRISLAWRLIENLYSEHSELLYDNESTFSLALGDLILEAWEARRNELVRQGIWKSDMTPEFVELLQEKHPKGQRDNTQQPSAHELQVFDDIGFMDNSQLDWEYWNDFMRL
ncbi:hypothetical protein BGZ63DRAFT_390329 [Mariannaea sp. PMI_226]|nr:hypothetical protein BGZ63DRAFT_390329 [Mariannaea sp. PMI_226]